MFILLNAIVASLDGLIIGISLKLSNTKLTFKNNIILLITNIFIYSTFITLYYLFQFKFMTTSITTILYLLLAWSAYKKDEDEVFDQSLTFKKTIIIALAHSLDGSIVSLNFVYSYNLLFIILLFSIASIMLLLVGYYFANIFKNIKKSNYISAVLFILLAILNLVL